MAPTTLNLVSLCSESHDAFIATIEGLPPDEQPYWIGQCHHWIHQPKLSSASLNGTVAELQKWDFLLVTRTSLSEQLKSHILRSWSITAEVQDDKLSSLHEAKLRRVTTTPPSLPSGWSVSDHAGLDASLPPFDVEASLALEAPEMGTSSPPILLKDFIRSHGISSIGAKPVAMMNLLSYMPNKRETYFKYIQAFQESTGVKYGGDPILLGQGVTSWSSQDSEDEKDGDWKWEDFAIVWYPSIWHFGKMLDDPGYAEVDRKFKVGSVRDNPILCCTEVDVKYRI